MVFVYRLRDPHDGAVRYVGQTANLRARMAMHEESGGSSASSPLNFWFRGLDARGKGAVVEVVAECATDVALDLEAQVIRDYKAEGARLLNIHHFRDVSKRKVIGRWAFRTARTVVRRKNGRRVEVEVPGREGSVSLLACGHYRYRVFSRFVADCNILAEAERCRSQKGGVYCYECAGLNHPGITPEREHVPAGETVPVQTVEEWLASL